jgi:hypothetical protein
MSRRSGAFTTSSVGGGCLRTILLGFLAIAILYAVIHTLTS